MTSRERIDDLVGSAAEFETAIPEKLQSYEGAVCAALEASPWQERYDELVAEMRRDLDAL